MAQEAEEFEAQQGNLLLDAELVPRSGAEEEAVVDELMVEEVSIDGMCGVY